MGANTGKEAFDYQFLVHTYFAVPDCTKCSVHGLQGMTYIDKMKDAKKFKEENKTVTIGEEVDRVYMDVPDSLTLDVDGSGKRSVNFKTTNIPDAVVWNPWVAKSKRMGDFADDEYKNMICVEPGFASPDHKVTLKPGENQSHVQVLTVN